MYHELKFDEKEAVDIDLPQLEKEMTVKDWKKLHKELKDER